MKASHERTNTVGLHLYEVPEGARVTETGRRRVGARGWENGALVLNGDTFSWEDGKVLETESGDGYTVR